MIGFTLIAVSILFLLSLIAQIVDNGTMWEGTDVFAFVIVLAVFVCDIIAIFQYF